MDQPIAVGVVGAGFGRYGLLPAFRRDPRCRVVAVCVTSHLSETKFSALVDIPRIFYNLSEMLAQVRLNAVAIAAPPKAQEAMALAVVNAGLSVFAEKPLASDLAAARLLLSEVEKARVAHAVDFMFPELDTWQRAYELLRSGAVGRIRHVMLDWRMESYDNVRRISSWKTDSAVGGGVLSHFGSHAFYNIEWLVGPIRHLTASLSSAPDLSVQAETLATIAVAFECGASGSLSLSSACVHGAGHGIEIYGESGALFLINRTHDPISGFRLLYRTRDDTKFSEIAEEAADRASGSEDSRVKPVARLATRFLDAVCGGLPARPSFADGVRVQALIEAARTSHAQHHRVDV
jgi:predicted dehydrogenase